MWSAFSTLCALALIPACFAGADPRVMGGDKLARDEAAPFVAWIVFDGDMICTGALVHKRYVLTVASCLPERERLYPMRFRVVLKDYRRKQKLDGEQFIVPQRIIPHPHFGMGGETMYDIALIQLAMDAPLDSKLMQQLPRVSTNSRDQRIMADEDVQCVALGWGNELKENGVVGGVNVMQKLDVFFTMGEACEQYENDNSVCYKSFKGSTCYDDKGLVLTCFWRNRWTLIGLQSKGSCTGGINVGTKVSSFRKWIRGAMIGTDKYVGQKWGEPCVITGQCLDELNTCNNGVCECITGYQPFKGKCYVGRDLGEKCEVSAQCYGMNQRCNDDGFCSCKPTALVVEGECFLKARLEDECVHTEQCIDSYQECDGGACACVADYVGFRKLCFPLKRNLNDSCLHGVQCDISNADCLGNKCVCPPMYIDSDQLISPAQCYRERSYGERCMVNNQCQEDTFQECDSTCTCRDEAVYIEEENRCFPKKYLNESCRYELQCTEYTDESECESNSTCKCVLGYQSSWQLNGDGDCYREKKLTEACEVHEQCIDGNQECAGNVCACVSGWTAYNGVCFEELSIDENCLISEQCVGDDYQYCDNTCKCQPEGVVRETDTCYPEKELTDGCQVNEQCVGDDQQCLSSTCQCVSGFTAIGGVCWELQPIGEQCEVSEQCHNPLQYCTTGGVCDCMPEGTALFNDTCYPLRYLNEQCLVNDQCFIDQECASNTCQCKSGFTSYNNTCFRDKAIDEMCEVSEQCVDGNTVCDLSSVCVCANGFVREVNDCWAEKELTEQCTHTVQCIGHSQECDTNVCACISGWTAYNSSCFEVKSFNDECVVSEQCVGDSYQTCSGTCQCLAENVVEVSSVCYPEVPLSGACTTDEQCTSGGTQVCLTSACACGSGWTEYNGVCFEEVAIEAECSVSEQCTGSNQACVGGYCGCVTVGAVLVGSTCETLAGYGESCIGDGQCVLDNALKCNTTSSSCICTDDYVYVAEVATCVQADGENCTFSEQCDDTQECNLVTKKCQCLAGYIAAGSDCYQPTGYGSACVVDQQCTLTNDSLTCDSLVCACPSGRVFASARPGAPSGACLLSAAIGGECLDDVQCGDRQTCSAGSNVCTCDDGLGDDGTNCYEGVGYAGYCVVSAQCVLTDGAGKCDTDRNACVCSDTHVEDPTAGACLEKVAYGESCSVLEQCDFASADCDTNCECMSGFVWHSSGSECLQEAGLFDPCTDSIQCTTSDSVCDSTSICVCGANYVYYDSNCYAEKSLGQGCTVDAQCTVGNSICSVATSNCACDGDNLYVEYSSSCVPGGLALDEVCQDSVQCYGSLICTGSGPSSCQCPDLSYIYTEGDCYLRKTLTEDCQKDGQCTASLHTCSDDDDECDCITNYVRDATNSSCIPTKYLTEACAITAQCFQAGAICNGGTCACDSDFVTEFGSCLAKKDEGEACSRDAQCTAVAESCIANVCTEV